MGEAHVLSEGWARLGAATAMDFKGAPFVDARHEKGVRILAPRHRGMWDIFLAA